jgi:hypothetical protein
VPSQRYYDRRWETLILPFAVAAGVAAPFDLDARAYRRASTRAAR